LESRLFAQRQSERLHAANQASLAVSDGRELPGKAKLVPCEFGPSRQPLEIISHPISAYFAELIGAIHHLDKVIAAYNAEIRLHTSASATRPDCRCDPGGRRVWLKPSGIGPGEVMISGFHADRLFATRLYGAGRLHKEWPLQRNDRSDRYARARCKSGPRTRQRLDHIDAEYGITFVGPSIAIFTMMGMFPK
jgi:hypothetical protein